MGLYLGNTNLTFGKRGEKGYTPIKDVDYFDGEDGLSAYDIAKQQGFNGTVEEFGAELANAVETQMLFGRFSSTITWNDVETEYTEIWTYNGDNYKQVMTEVSKTVTTIQLFINEVSVGIWTITTDEDNLKSETVYTTSV